MLRLLDYLHNPTSRDLAYSVLLGLMLSELHIGTCVAPPKSAMGFADEVCDLFLKLLQDKKSIGVAISVSVPPWHSTRIFPVVHFVSLRHSLTGESDCSQALEQCENQLKALCKHQHIEAICSSLRKLSARFTSSEWFYRCDGLQKKLRQQSRPCFKTHAMPVAQ